MSIAGLDVTTASMARVYDYWRGGREHFAADRAQAAAIDALYPPGSGPRHMVGRNRTWQERAVSSAVHDGIGQVLDLGSGFAAPCPLHEVAKSARTPTRVAYVDIDPLVVSHGSAATAGTPGVAFARADLGNPEAVMADPDVKSVIDPGRPCLAVFGLVLHFTSAADARRVIAGWADWLPSGSRFAVTVAHWADERLWERIRAVYGPAPLFNHSEIQLAGMMRGLDILGGGVEVARGWGPEAVESPGPGKILAAVARKI
jgi:hypothetical protein